MVLRMSKAGTYISTVCWAESRRQGADEEQGRPTETTAMAHVVSDSDYSVFTSSGNGVQTQSDAKEDLGCSSPIIIPITLNDKKTQMCVDSGLIFHALC